MLAGFEADGLIILCFVCQLSRYKSDVGNAWLSSV